MLNLRLDFPDGSRFGPGKAKLMKGIAETGSISAAARKMDLSYPKASRLVAEINSALSEAAILTEAGGAQRGGAKLSETGQALLQTYETILQTSLQATESKRLALGNLLPL